VLEGAVVTETAVSLLFVSVWKRRRRAGIFLPSGSTCMVGAWVYASLGA
jgi:hypothetical protein